MKPIQETIETPEPSDILKRMARQLVRAHDNPDIGLLLLVADEEESTIEIMSFSLADAEAMGLLEAALAVVERTNTKVPKEALN